MSETDELRRVWDHLVSHQPSRDLDGWVNCFAGDGAMEWPFRINGVPPRAEGREAIRAALEPIWTRAKEANRRIHKHDNVVFHRTTDPQVAIVEFDVVGETPRGSFRQSMLYVLRARNGQVLLLRDYVDTGGLSALIAA